MHLKINLLIEVTFSSVSVSGWLTYSALLFLPPSKRGNNQRFKRFLTGHEEIFKSSSLKAVDKFKTQNQRAQKQRKEKELPIPLVQKSTTFYTFKEHPRHFHCS